MVNISEIYGRSVTNRPFSDSWQSEQFGSAEFSNLCFLDHLVGGIYLEFLFRSLRIVVSLKIHHIFYKYFILFIPTYHWIDHTSNCKRSTYNRQNCCYEMVKRLPLKNEVETRIGWTRTRNPGPGANKVRFGGIGSIFYYFCKTFCPETFGEN